MAVEADLEYLCGKRAPLWNPDLSAAWIGLRAEHGQADLLASVVEARHEVVKHYDAPHGHR